MYDVHAIYTSCMDVYNIMQYTCGSMEEPVVFPVILEKVSDGTHGCH